jgi:hypothetical protein
MVDGVLRKRPEFNSITDPVTAEVEQWVQTLHRG